MGTFSGLSLKEYLEKLSSDAPVPGGGSVAAYTASLAMGLSQMVARIALSRKKKTGLSAEEEADAQRRRTLEEVLHSLDTTKKDAF